MASLTGQQLKEEKIQPANMVCLMRFGVKF